MESPKSSPRTQNSRPNIKRLWPLMPRNETDDRSGSLRLASPLAASGAACARHDVAPKAATAKTENKVLAKRRSFGLRLKNVLLETLASRIVVVLGAVARSVVGIWRNAARDGKKAGILNPPLEYSGQDQYVFRHLVPAQLVPGL